MDGLFTYARGDHQSLAVLEFRIYVLYHHHLSVADIKRLDDLLLERLAESAFSKLQEIQFFFLAGFRLWTSKLFALECKHHVDSTRKADPRGLSCRFFRGNVFFTSGLLTMIRNANGCVVSGDSEIFMERKTLRSKFGCTLGNFSRTDEFKPRRINPQRFFSPTLHLQNCIRIYFFSSLYFFPSSGPLPPS